MTDFIREVQEDLQRDRYLKLWRRFRYPLLGLVVGIIAAVVIVVVMEDASKARRDAEAARFVAATAELEAGKNAEALAAFGALAKESEGGYVALAQLRMADALIRSGDNTAAVAALDALAKDVRAEQSYRNLANLLAAERLIDTAPPEEIDSRIASLMAPDSPWRALARELKAASELKAGRAEAARATLSELVDDPTATTGVRFRARELLDGLGGPLPAPAPAPASNVTKSEAPPAESAAPETPAPDAPSEATGQ